ncbi:MAG: type II secretion system protein [Candidatus Moranbacteria bacterium]|nr:type II secretion system protein [Candidatus Moranbacteria bacterium]
MMKKNHTKRVDKKSKAFTLVEMLLVIAIIGILSSVVFVMFGDSQKAKRSSVMSTAKSALSFVQMCKFKGDSLTDVDGLDGSATDDNICTDSLEEWPKISIEGCVYDGTAGSGWDYQVDCTGASPNLGIISCTVTDGVCKWQ